MEKFPRPAQVSKRRPKDVLLFLKRFSNVFNVSLAEVRAVEVFSEAGREKQILASDTKPRCEICRDKEVSQFFFR